MKKFNQMNKTKRLYVGKGRRRQKGELSLVEAAGVMAAAALIALVVYMGRGYVMDRIHAMQFKSEAQYFVSGIQDATAGEIDFSSVTMLSFVCLRMTCGAIRRPLYRRAAPHGRGNLVVRGGKPCRSGDPVFRRTARRGAGRRMCREPGFQLSDGCRVQRRIGAEVAIETVQDAAPRLGGQRAGRIRDMAGCALLLVLGEQRNRDAPRFVLSHCRARQQRQQQHRDHARPHMSRRRDPAQKGSRIGVVHDRSSSGFQAHEPAQDIRLLGCRAFTPDDVLAVSAEPFFGPRRVRKPRGIERGRERFDGLAGDDVPARAGRRASMTACATPLAAMPGREEPLSSRGRGARACLRRVAFEQPGRCFGTGTRDAGKQHRYRKARTKNRVTGTGYPHRVSPGRCVHVRAGSLPHS